MKLPYSKFYWRDHISDTSLRSCSYAARGLWMDMLALMGMNDQRRGFLEAGGKPVTDPKQIARLTSGDSAEVERLLAELGQAGVFSKDNNDGCVYSRRMVRDEHLRAVRADAGSKGGTASQKQQGAILLKQNPKQTLEQKHKQSVGSGIWDLGSELPEGESREAEAIYSAYPRKVGKPAALKAIAKALVKKPDLLATVKAFADYHAKCGTEDQYIPHPATYFNQERFNDPLPQPQAKQPNGGADAEEFIMILGHRYTDKIEPKLSDFGGDEQKFSRARSDHGAWCCRHYM